VEYCSFFKVIFVESSNHSNFWITFTSLGVYNGGRRMVLRLGVLDWLLSENYSFMYFLSKSCAMPQFFGPFAGTVIYYLSPTILNVATCGASKVVILLSVINDDCYLPPREVSSFSGCARISGLIDSKFCLDSFSHSFWIEFTLLSSMYIGCGLWFEFVSRNHRVGTSCTVSFFGHSKSQIKSFSSKLGLTS